MHGIVGIHRHSVRCIIGIHPDERCREQVVWIDFKIRLELTREGLDSGIEATVDYVLMARFCSEMAQRGQYHLIEALAVDIAEQGMRRFHALWAWVRVCKPSAIPSAAYAYVEFECGERGA